MTREFTVTLSGTPTDVYTLCLGVTGAVPANGILPDRGQMLGISPNSASTVTYQDRNYANNAGYLMATSLNFGPFPTNSICYRDHFLSGAGQVVNILMTST